MSSQPGLAEAVRRAGPPVRYFLLGSALLGVGVAFFEVLTNLYLQGAGVPKSGIGGVLSQRAVGTVLGSLAAGPLLVSGRARAALVAASVLLALAMAGLVFATAPLEREASATLFGFAVTFRLVGSGPLLFRNARDPWLAALFGIDAAVIAGTQVLGSALAALLYEVLAEATGTRRGAFQGTMLIGASLVMASALAYARIREAPAAAAGAAPAAWPRPVVAAKLCIPFFLVGAGAGLTIPYLNLYFEDRFGASASAIALAYAAVAATTTLGYLGSPRLARRFGLVRSVVWSELASIPFFLMLALSWSFPLSVFAFLARGALMNLPYPLYGKFIMRVVAPPERERANALTKLAWNGSWVVTSRLSGSLLEGARPDYAAPMLASAGLYLLASASFWAFFRRTGE